MITLTKEWLQQTIAELEEERDAVPGVVNEDAAKALEAMKIALASLEAKSKLSNFIATQESLGVDFEKVLAENIQELYVPSKSTPPVSVSVPYYPETLPCPVMLEPGLRFGKGVPTKTMLGALQRRAEYYAELDAMTPDKRAEHEAGMKEFDSMLQGAEPVKTANKLPFEQWLSQQTGTIDVECGCVMTEVFFHWFRVAYEAGDSPVIPDGWKLVPAELTGAMTNAMTDAILDDLHNVDVWRSVLAAAPQQEVK